MKIKQRTGSQKETTLNNDHRKRAQTRIVFFKTGGIAAQCSSVNLPERNNVPGSTTQSAQPVVDWPNKKQGKILKKYFNQLLNRFDSTFFSRYLFCSRTARPHLIPYQVSKKSCQKNTVDSTMRSKLFGVRHALSCVHPFTNCGLAWENRTSRIAPHCLGLVSSNEWNVIKKSATLDYPIVPLSNLRY